MRLHDNRPEVLTPADLHRALQGVRGTMFDASMARYTDRVLREWIASRPLLVDRDEDRIRELRRDW